MAESPLNSLLEHRRQFLGFVQRRVSDAALAEDILQAAYVRALHHQGSLQQRESVVAWFYRVLRNAVIDHYRRRATESEALQQWGSEMEGAATAPPEMHDAVCACLDGALDTLATNYAELLRAVDLGEQPLQEFAAVHGISTSNAAVRAHRARAALRKQLIHICGVCSEHACENCTCKHAA